MVHADHEAFSYEPPLEDTDPEAQLDWQRETEADLPILKAIIDGHERLAVIATAQGRPRSLETAEAHSWTQALRKRLERLAADHDKVRMRNAQSQEKVHDAQLAVEVATSNLHFARTVTDRAEKSAREAVKRLEAMEASLGVTITSTIAHTPHPHRRSVLEEIADRFADDVEMTGGRRSGLITTSRCYRRWHNTMG